jgi:hypothetical protein
MGTFGLNLTTRWHIPVNAGKCAFKWKKVAGEWRLAADILFNTKNWRGAQTGQVTLLGILAWAEFKHVAEFFPGSGQT